MNKYLKELSNALIFPLSIGLLVAFATIYFEPKSNLVIRQLNSVDVQKDPILKDLASSNPEIYSGLYIQTFEIKNEGNKPVLIEDFVEPINLSTPEGNEIQLIIPLHSDLDDYTIEGKWERKSGQEWELKPFLLNPQERIAFNVSLKIAKQFRDRKDFDVNSVLRWNFRVIGVAGKPIYLNDYSPQEAKLELNIFNLFWIRFYGPVFFYFIFLSLLLFLLTFYLVGVPTTGSWKNSVSTFHVLIQLLLAFSTGEIILFFAYYRTEIPSPICYAIPLVHFAYLIIFGQKKWRLAGPFPLQKVKSRTKR